MVFFVVLGHGHGRRAVPAAVRGALLAEAIACRGSHLRRRPPRAAGDEFSTPALTRDGRTGIMRLTAMPEVIAGRRLDYSWRVAKPTG